MSSGSKQQQRSRLWLWLTAPHHALRRARAMYEKGMAGCASGAAVRVAVPRSRTHHGFRNATAQPPCSRDDDARELVCAAAAAKATEGEGGRGAVAPLPSRKRSTVAAMTRIDEYGPCSFERIM